MGGAGGILQHLPAGQVGHGAADVGGGQAQRRGGQDARRAQRLFDAVDPAQPAAHWPRHGAAAVGQPGPGPVSQPDLQIDPAAVVHHRNLDNLGRTGDAVGQGKAPGEILQRVRRRHHHRLRRAVIAECHRHLIGQLAAARYTGSAAVDKPGQGPVGLHHCPYSAAATMRRLRSDSAS